MDWITESDINWAFWGVVVASITLFFAIVIALKVDWNERAKLNARRRMQKQANLCSHTNFSEDADLKSTLTSYGIQAHCELCGHVMGVEMAQRLTDDEFKRFSKDPLQYAKEWVKREKKRRKLIDKGIDAGDS